MAHTSGLPSADIVIPNTSRAALLLERAVSQGIGATRRTAEHNQAGASTGGGLAGARRLLDVRDEPRLENALPIGGSGRYH